MISKANLLNRSVIHLIHRAGQSATDIFHEQAQANALTPRQFTVLMTIAEQEGLTQSDLVERTGIDRSTLADIVARLLARGFIQRKRAKDDGRAYAIKLTAQGQRELRQTQPAAVAADARLLDALPATKREEFLDQLELIVASTRK
jgi:DNA-binding MarR family transcriptional regulator